MLQLSILFDLRILFLIHWNLAWWFFYLRLISNRFRFLFTNLKWNRSVHCRRRHFRSAIVSIYWITSGDSAAMVFIPFNLEFWRRKLVSAGSSHIAPTILIRSWVICFELKVSQLRASNLTFFALIEKIIKIRLLNMWTVHGYFGGVTDRLLNAVAISFASLKTRFQQHLHFCFIFKLTFFALDDWYVFLHLLMDHFSSNCLTWVNCI